MNNSQYKLYLERIGLDPALSLKPTVNTLFLLQDAHLNNVPFEYLDIHFDKDIVLNEELLFEKIVIMRRGGYCFEQNGLFALLLEHIGFKVKRLAGWIPSCKNDFDHMALRVWCEGASEPYLADVGFRKGAALPIKFVEGPVQKDVMGSYKLERDEHGALWLWRTKDDAQFEQLYKIAEKNFKLGDFQERCDYFVHSEGSPLKKKPGASLQSDAGLINMNDEVLLVPRQAQHDTCGGGLNFTFEVSEEINPLSFSKKLISDFGIVAPSPKLSRPINSTTQVYDVEEVVALENELAQTTLPLLDMMQRAGCALAEIAECTLKMQALAMPDDTQTQVVSIFSGSGNNGGDGAVAALELAKLGYGVNLIIPKNPGEYTRQPAKTTFAQLKYENLNVIVNPTQDEISKILEETNLILDCILGCGFSYDKVREPYAIWIKLINKISQEKSIPLISADVPSGMNAQTGELADCAIYADLTLTMLRAKHGLMEKDAKAQAGMIFLADLEL